MKLLFVSLGCDKNLVDSEKMLGALAQAGYEMTDDESEAEAAVVNTCCFIHDAKQESIDTILRLGALKNDAVLKYLVITGCLAQRYSADITEAIPEVDAILGTTAWDELINVLDGLRKGSFSERTILKDIDYDPVLPGRRLKSDINHYSYLKIAEGCDKHCTYCVIPGVKGRYRSYELDSLVAEAEQLAAAGVNELMVIAQETSLYGTDRYGRRMLPELLNRLCLIEGLTWIRLMYCYPEEIDDELIRVMASQPKICHYIDMPIQHAADSVLHRMGRRTDRAQIEDIIRRLRAAMPDMTIRTSLISGFPGETDEEHAQLLEFLGTMRLDRVGVFTYSREEGTPAARMKGQIPRKIKEQRRKELMLVQQKCVFDKNKALEGHVIQVMIDGRLPEEGVYVARTYMDAPDIDGCVFVSSDRELVAGTVIDAAVTGSRGYDLVAEECQ